MILDPAKKTIDGKPITTGQVLEVSFDGVTWDRGTIHTAGEGRPSFEYVRGPYRCWSDIREPVQARMI
jgi:hypothetical protein